MNPLIRWLRFNLVGVMGVAVQLTALATFTRVAPRHLLLDSAAAVELAILHNFLWHMRYTWADVAPNQHSRATTRLLRFQLANGLVSLAGNVFLMHLLVGRAHLPPLAANCIAILSCSALNFTLSHTWTFAPSRAAYFL